LVIAEIIACLALILLRSRDKTLANEAILWGGFSFDTDVRLEL
jgi:hypothetical protein